LKKQDKINKTEKPLNTTSNNTTSDEKNRRKQVEIELKKWEREQVLIIYSIYIFKFYWIF